MSDQCKSNGNDKLFRTILILQSDHAHWFKLYGRRIEDYCCEAIRQDDSDQDRQCPWLYDTGDGELHVVDLVLDSSLDELDRITVEQSDNDILNRYRRWVTRLRLRRDYPDATVYALPQGYGDFVAAVMRPIIPALWSSWLERQQLSDTVFLRVSTGSEVAARWSEKYNSCVLLGMKSACFERHLLIDTGVMLFLRTISTHSTGHAPDIQSALHPTSEKSLETEAQYPYSMTDSVEYLERHHLVRRDHFQSLSVQINASGAMDIQNAGAVVDSVNPLVFEPQSGTSMNPCAATAPNDTGVTGMACVAVISDSVLTILHMLLDSESASESCDGQRVPNSILRRIAEKVTGRIPGWFFPDTDTGRPRLSSTCKSSSSHRWLPALQPSHRHLLGLRRQKTLRRASLVFLLVALLSVGVSLVKVSGRLQLIKENDKQRHDVTLESGQLSLDILALSSVPDAAESLLLADQLGHSSVVVPAALLDSIATVITAHPDIELDRIAWHMILENEPYASLDHGVSVATSRRSVVADEEPAWLQLELVGRVSGRTLAIQQSVFELYINDLSAMGNVADTRVFDYPADSALSSEFEKGDLSFFKVALVIGS